MTPHTILLRPPRELDPGALMRAAGVSGPPALLQRGDEDFVDATLEGLRNQTSRTDLATTLAGTRVGGVLKLFQPVQRQFHLAVLEAICDAPGAPRVDPARIESAGMVLRLLLPDGSHKGWMRSGGKLRGWAAIGAQAETDDRYDPLPAQRLAGKALGPPSIARQLTAQAASVPGALLAEHVIPLYLAPPDVCAEAGKTLYYGLVPTASSELSETPGETPPGFGPTTDAFRGHLVGPLRGDAMSLPHPGDAVSPAWRDEAEIAPGMAGYTPGLSQFVLMLRQLAIEFDAFGEFAACRALYAALETISLPLVLRSGETTPRTVTAGTFMRACVAPLLERDANAPTPEMPASWPALDATAAARLASSLAAALAVRFSALRGRAGRFDQPDARYQVRAFLRVKPECGCPARTIWSGYSEPFTIAPWYETADGASAPVQIPLPDVTNRNLLKSLKPNVAFVVPPALNNLLGGNAKDLADGKGDASPDPDLQWICAFSIPIITICAFIVLNIFLQLFDLIFRWLLFIKICIPFPKFGGGSNNGGGS
jgi:hypothetical protein